jgi:hypothetical protein
MTATYINRQFEGTYTYFDLMFENEGEQLLRLGGVSFGDNPTIDEMENNAREIAMFNLPDYELTNIII